MDDTGKYRCVASNSMGTEKTRAAALLVLGKVTSQVYLLNYLLTYLPARSLACLLAYVSHVFTYYNYLFIYFLTYKKM